MSGAREIFESDGPAATEALGARVAAGLRGGDVVYLLGELGAGKTTFVRGAARALGVEGPVTSPTFALAHRYRARERLVLSHLDLYRLGGALGGEDGELLGEYLGPDAVVFVEWPPENAPALLGAPALTVSFAHAGGERRRVEVSR